jgi:hypothetical protein
MTKLKLLLFVLLAVPLAYVAPPAAAQLRIDITSGVTDPIPVASCASRRTRLRRLRPSTSPR